MRYISLRGSSGINVNINDRDQFKIAISHRIEMSDAFYLYLQNKIDEALKSNSEYKEKALTLDNKQITEKDLMNYLVFVGI